MLQMNFNQKEFCDLLLDGFERYNRVEVDDFLLDTNDGRIHQELKESGYLRLSNNLTGTMFIDGVSLFKDGQESSWRTSAIDCNDDCGYNFPSIYRCALSLLVNLHHLNPPCLPG